MVIREVCPKCGEKMLKNRHRNEKESMKYIASTVALGMILGVAGGKLEIDFLAFFGLFLWFAPIWMFPFIPTYYECRGCRRDYRLKEVKIIVINEQDDSFQFQYPVSVQTDFRR